MNDQIFLNPDLNDSKWLRQSNVHATLIPKNQRIPSNFVSLVTCYFQKTACGSVVFAWISLGFNRSFLDSIPISRHPVWIIQWIFNLKFFFSINISTIIRSSISEWRKKEVLTHQFLLWFFRLGSSIFLFFPNIVMKTFTPVCGFWILNTGCLLASRYVSYGIS